jgi:AAA domain/Bifunctional DNA primase/polymerase, N-terminal
MNNEETRPPSAREPGLNENTDDDQDAQYCQFSAGVTSAADCYAAVSRDYQRRGWHPIPLAAGTKWPPPHGYTGLDGLTPSGADIAAWCEDRPADNVAIRMPENVIGLDVDDYGDKHGGDTLAEHEERLGPLPRTWRSTSRPDDPVSGIRVYRVPPGWTGVGALDGGCVEVIQRHHRYAVAAPSSHPEGRLYVWLDANTHPCEIPNVSDLPSLPQAWLDGLHRPVTKSSGALRLAADEILTDGEPDERVATRLTRALADLSGGSRFDHTRGHVLALMRFGKEGHAGVKAALQQLGDAYVPAVADRTGTKEAVEEYRRLMFSQGVARELAQPSYEEQEREFDRWARELYGPVQTLSPDPADLSTGESGGIAGLSAKLLSRSALRNLPKPEPLIENVLDQGTTALLYGKWGTLKTFIALDWGASVAVGRAWQGRATEKRRVLYVAAEGAFGIAARIDAWEIGWRKAIADGELEILPCAVNLTRASEVAELAALVKDNGYGFVVLDTLARSMVGADENSAQDCGVVVHSMNLIREATPDGLGVVLGVHHTGKDGKTFRGSSVFEAGADTIYAVTPDCEGSQVVTLEREKRKDGPTGDHHMLCLDPVPGAESCVISVHRGADKTASADRLLSVFVHHFVHTGASQADLRKVADMAPATFHRAVNELVQRGELVNIGTHKRPFFKGQS